MAQMRGIRANQLHGAPYEMFKGRKIPASSWDRWKERWTPNWLRWLFPVSYRIVKPPFPAGSHLYQQDNTFEYQGFNHTDLRFTYPNQLPLTETQLNDRGEEDPSSSRS